MKKMKKINFILFFILPTICLFSCTNRPRNVLNQSEMAEVIVELHKMDGIVAVLRSDGKIDNDSTQGIYYAAVLKKFDLTQSQFDSSLVWYSKNPKRFESVYIAVEENLKKWEADVKNGKFGVDSVSDITTTLLERISQIKIKDTADFKQVQFDVRHSSLLPHDVYTLSFLQKIDSTKIRISPKILMKINYADGVSDSVVAVSHADGITRRFKIRFPAKRLLHINSVSADLLVPDTLKTSVTATFDSIKITRTYNVMAQDSLQKYLQKNIKFEQPAVSPINPELPNTKGFMREKGNRRESLQKKRE
jgi:acyl carrier protein